MKLDTFTQAYIDALVWSSDDETEAYSEATVSEALKVQAAKDCEEFQRFHAGLYEGLNDDQAGHYFALSRNGHGAGFFDVGMHEAQKAARVYGCVDVYVGDDGQLYT
jgi:hypothetical protein